jgi:hypothetical protein
MRSDRRPGLVRSLPALSVTGIWLSVGDLPQGGYPLVSSQSPIETLLFSLRAEGTLVGIPVGAALRMPKPTPPARIYAAKCQQRA